MRPLRFQKQELRPVFNDLKKQIYPKRKIVWSIAKRRFKMQDDIKELIKSIILTEFIKLKIVLIENK